MGCLFDPVDLAGVPYVTKDARVLGSIGLTRGI